MKYYIEYPIPIKCDLQCYYCVMEDAWRMQREGTYHDGYSDDCAFTPEQFKAWRDKHLTECSDFLYELSGGEPSCSGDYVFNVLDTLDKGKFQIQSNGLGTSEFYKKLAAYKDKIDRVGFTFHRKVIADKKELVQKFKQNANILKKSGINFYVKELLYVDEKSNIIDNKRYWELQNVEFRIQDFKGYKGKNGAEHLKYSEEDWKLIHMEYKHCGNKCFCREGRKSILIRGFDIFRGDVLACWHDPTVIGNIIEGWYKPYDYVQIGSQNERDVIGVEKKYRGTYPKDKWIEGIEKYYPSYNKNNLKTRSGIMSTWRMRELERLSDELKKVDDMIQNFTKNMQLMQNEINQAQFSRAAINGAVEILQAESAAEAQNEQLFEEEKK